jgi:hypothetical protein
MTTATGVDRICEIFRKKPTAVSIPFRFVVLRGGPTADVPNGGQLLEGSSTGFFVTRLRRLGYFVFLAMQVNLRPVRKNVQLSRSRIIRLKAVHKLSWAMARGDWDLARRAVRRSGTLWRFLWVDLT